MSNTESSLAKMRKGLSLQLMVIVAIFVIVLVISLVLLTVGKEYLYQITDQFFNIFGKKT